MGHSVLGHWVNLGAMTTTSNLKNTYGEVALDVAGTRLASGRQFLGSLIGDHAKTAIGTLLPTGTVVGAGANVFGSANAPKYVPPMAWGSEGAERMTEDGFLKVAERVMPRRDVAFTPERRASPRRHLPAPPGRRVTTVYALGCRSSGNAFAVACDGAALLVDAGFSAREIGEARRGCRPRPRQPAAS